MSSSSLSCVKLVLQCTLDLAVCSVQILAIPFNVHTLLRTFASLRQWGLIYPIMKYVPIFPERLNSPNRLYQLFKIFMWKSLNHNLQRGATHIVESWFRNVIHHQISNSINRSHSSPCSFLYKLQFQKTDKQTLRQLHSDITSRARQESLTLTHTTPKRYLL
jgi:hypothetical protein